MAKNTIRLKNFLNIINEETANAAIRPGDLIELMSTDKVRKHANAGQNVVPVMFAIENVNIGGDIGDNYAANDKVQAWIPQRGDEVYAIVKDDTVAIVIGDPLESAGDGGLQKHVADVESFESADPGSITVYPQNIVAIALEAVDVSGSSGEESQNSSGLGWDKRIKVRII